MLATLYAARCVATRPAAQSRRTSWATGMSLYTSVGVCPARFIGKIRPCATPYNGYRAHSGSASYWIGALILTNRSPALVAATNLIEILDSVGEPRGWGVSVLSPVVYVGPKEAAWPLATWRRQQEEAVAQLPRGTSTTLAPFLRRLLGRALTEPRRAYRILACAAQVPARGLDQIPHDLWPAQDAAATRPAATTCHRPGRISTGPSSRSRRQRSDCAVAVRVKADATAIVFRRSRRQEISPLCRPRCPRRNLSCRTRHSTWSVEPRITNKSRAGCKVHLAAPRLAGKRADKRFTLTVQNQPIEAILQAVTRQTDLQLVWEPNQRWLAANSRQREGGKRHVRRTDSDRIERSARDVSNSGKPTDHRATAGARPKRMTNDQSGQGLLQSLLDSTHDLAFEHHGGKRQFTVHDDLVFLHRQRST